MQISRIVRASLTAALILGGLSVSAQGRPAVFQVDGVALRGYDPVAYFDGTAREGSASFEYSHQGVAWRFVSAANRAKFIADPARFMPQFGGFCALGMAHGGGVPSDPQAFTIHEDKLYLNASLLVRTTWRYEKDWMIGRAEPNWQRWLTAPPIPPNRQGPPPRPDTTLALEGFDVTSYYEAEGLKAGDSTHALQWKGKTWRFRSAAHKARFERSPESFAPQYDGFSPLIMAHGQQFLGNPRIYTIVDGKLYIEIAEGPRETWRRSMGKIIPRSDEQWQIYTSRTQK